MKIPAVIENVGLVSPFTSQEAFKPTRRVKKGCGVKISDLIKQRLITRIKLDQMVKKRIGLFDMVRTPRWIHAIMSESWKV
jgi:hypothetical protein